MRAPQLPQLINASARHGRSQCKADLPSSSSESKLSQVSAAYPSTSTCWSWVCPTAILKVKCEASASSGPSAGNWGEDPLAATAPTRAAPPVRIVPPPLHAATLRESKTKTGQCRPATRAATCKRCAPDTITPRRPRAWNECSRTWTCTAARRAAPTARSCRRRRRRKRCRRASWGTPRATRTPKGWVGSPRSESPERGAATAAVAAACTTWATWTDKSAQELPATACSCSYD